MTRADFIALYVMIGLGMATASTVEVEPVSPVLKIWIFILNVVAWPVFLGLNLGTFLLRANEILAKGRKSG